MKGLGHQVEVIHPGLFDTRPCPGFAGIDLAVRPEKALTRRLDAIGADAIHLATEGPLGWAARRYCLRRRLAFTTAFHTRCPEILKATLRVPLCMGYALFRHFHRPSAGVLVPGNGVLGMLKARGFANLRKWTHGVDVRQFNYREVPQVFPPLGALARPVSLYVGRVSHEKNIDAFLQLDVPGTKVVCGVGPLEATLRQRYPHVRWLGVLPRDALAQVYAAADVFVMPSRCEAFGLVMLEAMACGTPVAAYPVDGPLEVLGEPACGGALHDDLAQAWYQALSIARHTARARAQAFSWAHASQLFVRHLVAARQGALLDKGLMIHNTVTQLSSNS
jgi:glycosyltransferase involved in cell wall biosynthesis